MNFLVGDLLILYYFLPLSFWTTLLMYYRSLLGLLEALDISIFVILNSFCLSMDLCLYADAASALAAAVNELFPRSVGVCILVLLD
jgi:hypothetical protein